MSRKFNFEADILSTDQIGELTTEEIQRHIFRVKRAIKEADRMGYNTTPHEVEYCYLDHERQQRLNRTERNQLSQGDR